ncbi:hypothetical protein AB0D94_32750 [Streptomyces sp. NPDC048255]|uniref:hypothetical protein n=1 Tax=Streptomyces sp. NPDC048255 TaxID=3154713 RepID=UPI0033E2B5A5
MPEWKRISTGRLHPVPTPATTSIVWAVTAVTALALVTAFNLLDGHGDPTLDLVALSLTVGLVSTGARLTAAPGTALLCWFILNGFATAPFGELTWQASYDLARIICLLVSAGTGTVMARLAHARTAYHRLTP